MDKHNNGGLDCAKDLLHVMQLQREQAMNALAYAQAEIMMLKRQIIALEGQTNADNEATGD